uniref:TSA: Wollemia nobilis Ref_Wollemi_Transcript_9431_3919 transcribed RNA sequence n=1 Tax=Wollemia nobilis TaxID=56998 RepID=A0A0C9QU83_9CONI
MDSLDAKIAILLGPDAAPFETLIEHLMSAGNESRGQAEELFNVCKQKHPDTLLLKLVHIIQYTSQPGLRSMAAVLLRKQIGIWTKLSDSSRHAVKAQILVCLQREEAKTVLKKLCDTVAELAASISDEDNWPELLTFLFQSINSDVLRLKEIALLVLGQLAQYMGSQLHPHLTVLHGIFQQTLSPSMPGDVRLAALRATASLVQSLESSQDRDLFQDLLPAMIETLRRSLELNEEVIAQEALEMFIEVAGTAPQFLRKQLPEVLTSMLQIAEAQSLEEGMRHLALEFIITLAEARDRAPGMMRKLPQFIGKLFAILVNLLLDVEDDVAWYTAETENEDAGVTSNYEVGQECLDRLSNSLGGNTILPVASELLPSYISDQDWRKRHAALITLAQIAEGCDKVMTKNLEPVVNMVLNSFKDPHPRVRWASINALGQLSTDLGPDLQEQFHQRVVPALIDAMADFQNPRVQAHAAAAILNFSEGCTPDILAPYLDGIVTNLLVLLQNGKHMVQEGALTALASVADCSQSSFQVYYDTVMPYLKAILLNATDKSNRMLRAKSMECISLVGMAVGKEKFGQDAKQVMEVLMNLQRTPMEDDDPTISYMLQAWARLCKCLGQDFLPYMSIVMPPLLHSAQLKPDVTITDADDPVDEEIDSDDDSVETITIGDKRIGIRTSVLEEKATACNMLCCYADELKEGFYPWVDQVVQILVPLLKFYFHEEVRKAAVSAMPELLRAGKLAVDKRQAQGRDESYVRQLSDYIISSLVEALNKEPETEILVDMLSSLNECIQIAGSSLEPELVKKMFDEFKQVITASMSRKGERIERSKSDDFDAEERELLQEENSEEEEVFDQIGECLGTVLKLFKSTILPYFDELVSFITPMLGKDRTAEERRVAICIFDDVAEECGVAATKYYDTFVPFLLEACTDEDADVRQAAVYGIGVCAERGGAKMKPLVGEALSKLNTVISHPSAFHSDNRMATDNAISALGKICEHQRDCIDASQVVPAWLSCLPIKNDLIEAKVLHELLCSMVERSDPQLLGPGNQYLPKIISVFAEILCAGADLASEDTISKIVRLLRQLQQTMPPPALASTWSSLQPQQQAALQSILSPQA